MTTVMEPKEVHNIGDKSERRETAFQKCWRRWACRASSPYRYHHEFSGGQRQRIGIARSLAVRPELVVADEAVSALDVSVQAQVLNLLKELQAEFGLTYIFISHDLSVVKFMSDMMAVMNNGKFVEFGPSEAIYENPKEAYTERLIEVIPRDSLSQIDKRQAQRREAQGIEE